MFVNPWCDRRWIMLLGASDVSHSKREVFFGIDAEAAREHDVQPPLFLKMCAQHYALLRRKDGVELGYRRDKTTGRNVAYVKDYYF